MREFAVIGGGIGGCSAAALLNAEKKEVVLFEKEGYLGGCASTFCRGGRLYNAGATTLSGYGEGERVKKMFEKIGVYPKVIESDPAITVIHQNKTIRRFRDLEMFLGEIQKGYPDENHKRFWESIIKIQNDFYDQTGYYYSGGSISKKIISLFSFIPLFAGFFPLPVLNGKKWVESFYGKLTPEYEDFLNGQVLIVAQATIDKISALALILSLGYAFRQTHYPIGGMGAICDTLVSKVEDIRKNSEVKSIQKLKDGFRITTNSDISEAENIVFGGSIFDNTELFLDKEIKDYFAQYKYLDNKQSAFVVYLTIKSDKKFDHHYQLIAKEQIKYTISKAVFVSFSDSSDNIISKNGEYSVTASIHVDATEWTGLSKTEYGAKKANLCSFLIEWICKSLEIDGSSVIDSFAATPKTFYRFTKRVQLGGNAMSLANPVFRLPPNDARIKGLYMVGDTVYPAQGWPGVVSGVENLSKVLTV